MMFADRLIITLNDKTFLYGLTSWLYLVVLPVSVGSPWLSSVPFVVIIVYELIAWRSRVAYEKYLYQLQVMKAWSNNMSMPTRRG